MILSSFVSAEQRIIVIAGYMDSTTNQITKFQCADDGWDRNRHRHWMNNIYERKKRDYGEMKWTQFTMNLHLFDTQMIGSTSKFNFINWLILWAHLIWLKFSLSIFPSLFRFFLRFCFVFFFLFFFLFFNVAFAQRRFWLLCLGWLLLIRKSISVKFDYFFQKNSN